MPQDSTARSLPIALLRARERVMAPIRDMLADSPVNEQKWRVLRVLEEAGPSDQKAIADGASLLLPSLTRILQGMQRDGLVDRSRDPSDGRRQIVSLTGAGQAILDRYRVEGRAILTRIEAQLGVDKTAQLLDLLEDLRDLGDGS